jgi:hypothetical protein
MQQEWNRKPYLTPALALSAVSYYNKNTHQIPVILIT